MSGIIMHSLVLKSVLIFILNNSVIWLENMKPNPCGYTMKVSCRYQRIFIYDVKRTTKVDGMGQLIGASKVPMSSTYFSSRDRFLYLPRYLGQFNQMLQKLINN